MSGFKTMYVLQGFIILFIVLLVSCGICKHLTEKICTFHVQLKTSESPKVNSLNDALSSSSTKSEKNEENSTEILQHEKYFSDLGAFTLAKATFIITCVGFFFGIVSVLTYIGATKAHDKISGLPGEVNKIIAEKIAKESEYLTNLISQFEPELTKIKDHIKLARFSDEKVIGELVYQKNKKEEEVDGSDFPDYIKKYNDLLLKNFYFWSEFIWATNALKSIDVSIRLKAIYTLGSLVGKTRFAKDILDNIYDEDIVKKKSDEWYALKYARGK